MYNNDFPSQSTLVSDVIEHSPTATSESSVGVDDTTARLYNMSISAAPLQQQGAFAASSELAEQVVVKCGHLLKCAKHRKSWKRRWFVLNRSRLSSYKDDQEYELRGTIPLSEIRTVSQARLSSWRSNTFVVVTRGRTYRLQSANHEDLVSWMTAFACVLNVEPMAPMIEEADESRYLPADNPQRSAPRMQTYTLSYSGKLKGWVRKWLVLRERKLYIYKSDKEYELHRIIDFDVDVLDLFEELKDETHRRRYRIRIVTPNKLHLFASENEAEHDELLTTLERTFRESKHLYL